MFIYMPTVPPPTQVKGRLMNLEDIYEGPVEMNLQFSIYLDILGNFDRNIYLIFYVIRKSIYSIPYSSK